MRMSESDFDDVMNINLKGYFNMIRFATPVFVKQNQEALLTLQVSLGLQETQVKQTTLQVKPESLV